MRIVRARIARIRFKSEQEPLIGLGACYSHHTTASKLLQIYSRLLEPYQSIRSVRQHESSTLFFCSRINKNSVFTDGCRLRRAMPRIVMPGRVASNGDFVISPGEVFSRDIKFACSFFVCRPAPADLLNFHDLHRTRCLSRIASISRMGQPRLRRSLQRARSI